MSLDPKASNLLALEQDVLRALCSTLDSPPGRQRSHLLCLLNSHPWSYHEHRVVFDALRRTPGRSPEALREQLPAEATRMGFPDVDWPLYFNRSNSGSAHTAENLIASLLRTSSGANKQS